MKEYIIPDFIDYPELFNVSEYSSLFNNLYSYVIDPYPIDVGYSLYIGFRDEYMFMRLADLKSNKLELNNDNNKFVLKYSDKLFNIMKVSGIREACYYFSGVNNPILVDVMISANKFIGPGMLRDVYSKVIPTQKISEIAMLSVDNFNNFSGKIVKPSRFKYVIEEKYFRPLYGIIK